MNTVFYKILCRCFSKAGSKLWRKISTFGVYLQHLRGGDKRAKSLRTSLNSELETDLAAIGPSLQRIVSHRVL